MSNSLARKKTFDQSARIRASVEEARQQKKRGWHAHPVFRGRPLRLRKHDTPNLPGPSWWCDCDPVAFYAEAKRRSDLREQQMAEHSLRAPNELGVA